MNLSEQKSLNKFNAEKESLRKITLLKKWERTILERIILKQTWKDICEQEKVKQKQIWKEKLGAKQTGHCGEQFGHCA